MNDPASFAKLVPGFDFLQNLVKNAGAALPGIGQWVAPTIDPAELEKRIEELRTVQFWLEQNARMLGATIQAMEVQRMTLSTLKTMNVQMEDLRDALQIRMPTAPEPAPASKPMTEPEPTVTKAPAEAATPPAPGVVDPMQWWGALTKQFTELATTAMKDTASDAARNLAGAMVKKSFDGASRAVKTASSAPAKAVRKTARKGTAKTPARKKPAARAEAPNTHLLDAMNRFLHGHATHPDARMALALAAAQIEAQRLEPGHAAVPTLGWVYLTEPFAAQAGALIAEMTLRWPAVEWVGATGVGIAASGVEYFDEPALSLMLTDLPREHFRVFSGARPLAGFAAHTAQVHADPGTADLAELIKDMSARTDTGYLFGGLASGQARALHIAGGALSGGLSGVAFDAGVALVSRVTQGCQPVGPLRRVGAAERNVVTELDGEPALDCLLRDLALEGIDARAALPKLRQTLVGLIDAPGGDGARDDASDPHRAATRSAFDTTTHRGAFGADTRVRRLVGIDPGRRGIAIADHAEPGMQLAFCSRNMQAARRDLTRICAEVREEVEPEALPLPAALGLGARPAGEAPALPASGIAGAVYVSCAGRGGAHFGAPSAELAIVRHALGDVPLVGFFAAGEIARHHLYGYTGVLTVFRR